MVVPEDCGIGAVSFEARRAYWHFQTCGAAGRPAEPRQTPRPGSLARAEAERRTGVLAPSGERPGWTGIRNG